MSEVKLTAKSDRCPQCISTNGEAYDDEYDTHINHSDNELVACRVFSCNDCGKTTDFAWYDNGSKLNPNAVIDNLNGEYEESK
tara:strand:- start:136 stop:384 length:249 start_codon:yes stop_codon:yes gene_type:complete